MVTELPARVGRRSSRGSSLQQFMCEFTNGKWPGMRLLACVGLRFGGQVAYQSLGHALLSKLFHGFRVLRQMAQTHAAQHVGCLGELDVVVAHNLYAVDPRVEKIEERPW